MVFLDKVHVCITRKFFECSYLPETESLAKRRYDAHKADADEADAPAECSLSASDLAGNVLYDVCMTCQFCVLRRNL